MIEIGPDSAEGVLLKIGSSRTTEKYRELALHILSRVVGKDRIRGTIIDFEKRALLHKKFADSEKHKAYISFDPKLLGEFRKELDGKYKRWLDDQ